MVANFSVDIRFDDSYYKKLGLTKKAGFDDALDRAVDHAINEAVNTCRREAPLDTGQLRRKTDKMKPQKCVGEVVNTAKNGNDELYWQYVQYGTSKMSANPFVTRTARKIKPKLHQYVLEELKNANVLD